MDKRTIRVATRKSPLAIRQTEMAISELKELRPDWEFEVIRMSTTGDDRLAWSLETTGGKGLFTSALEEAIVNNKADLAVHSAKDLPTEMPEGVALVGFLPRAPACVDVCSRCHPFFTGKQKIVDSGGRVDRFNKRFAGRSLRK